MEAPGRHAAVSKRIKEYEEFDPKAGRHFLVLERTILPSDEQGTNKEHQHRIFSQEESTIGPMRHTFLAGPELTDSANVVSIEILDSIVGYPINIYDTVLVRDDLDFKCVYIFRRDRNDPQLIKSSGEALALTGPSRGLVVYDNLYVEINLKIKGSQQVDDKDFSKGMRHYGAVPIPAKIKRDKFSSWLSTVQITHTRIRSAVEATVDVRIARIPDYPNFKKAKKGAAHFYGKISACTSSIRNEMVLYDSEVSNTAIAISDGFDELCRRVIAVPIREMLLLRIDAWNGDRTLISASAPDRFLKVGHSTRTINFTPKVCGEGLADVFCSCYRVEVKVVWSALHVTEFDDAMSTGGAY